MNNIPVRIDPAQYARYASAYTIDPAAWQAANEQERAEMLRQAREATERHRQEKGQEKP